MGGLLGQIIPIGLLLALGLTRIMSTILLLTSAHPQQNAQTFLWDYLVTPCRRRQPTLALLLQLPLRHFIDDHYRDRASENQ